MKILVDVNLEEKWVKLLNAHGYESRHWKDIGPGNAKDEAIQSWARENGYTVVTRDRDFAQSLILQKESKPSVVIGVNKTSAFWPSEGKTAEVLLWALDKYKDEINAGAIVVLKLRDGNAKAQVTLLPFREKEAKNDNLYDIERKKIMVEATMSAKNTLNPEQSLKQKLQTPQASSQAQVKLEVADPKQKPLGPTVTELSAQDKLKLHGNEIGMAKAKEQVGWAKLKTVDPASRVYTTQAQGIQKTMKARYFHEKEYLATAREHIKTLPAAAAKGLEEKLAKIDQVNGKLSEASKRLEGMWNNPEVKGPELTRQSNQVQELIAQRDKAFEQFRTAMDRQAGMAVNTPAAKGLTAAEQTHLVNLQAMPEYREVVKAGQDYDKITVQVTKARTELQGLESKYMAHTNGKLTPALSPAEVKTLETTMQRKREGLKTLKGMQTGREKTLSASLKGLVAKTDKAGLAAGIGELSKSAGAGKVAAAAFSGHFKAAQFVVSKALDLAKGQER